MTKIYLHYYCFGCQLTLVMEQPTPVCGKCGKPVAWLGHIPTVNLKPTK